MDVDRDAPAYAEGSVVIEASRDTVWRVLTDIGSWPTWNPGVKSAQIDVSPAPGVGFKWKSGPGTIRSVIEEVDEPRAIGWTGRTLGIKARHAWQLDEDDGRTTVTTQESSDGLVVKLLRRSIQPTLQRAIDDGLAALKTESERIP